MQKWEYLTMVSIGGDVVRIDKETFPIYTPFDDNIPNDISIIDFMKDFGGKGWELVGFDTQKVDEYKRPVILFVFKRPLE